MGLAKTDEKLFDLRTVKRYIKKGRITTEQYDRYVATLADASGKAETIPIEAVLGEEGDLGKRKYIPAYKHRRERDFSGVTFEDEFDDDVDVAEYGIEEGLLSTRSDTEIDE